MSIIGYSDGTEQTRNCLLPRELWGDVTEVQIEELDFKRAFVHVTLRYHADRKPCPLYCKFELNSYKIACEWFQKPEFSQAHFCKIPAPNQNTIGAPNGP